MKGIEKRYNDYCYWCKSISNKTAYIEGARMIAREIAGLFGIATSYKDEDEFIEKILKESNAE